MVDSDLQPPEPAEATSGPSPHRRARRSSRTALPWRWLGIGLLVIVILAATVYLAREAVPAQPLLLGPTATATVVEPTPTAQPPPTSTPTSEPATATPKPTPTRVEIGPGVEVEVVGAGVDKLSFRSGPGQDYARLRIISDGDTFVVLEGPEEADGYRWWRLKDDAGIIGWVADNWLQPVGQ